MPRKSRRRLANRWVFSTQPLLDHFGPNTPAQDIAQHLGTTRGMIHSWRTHPRHLDTHAADRYAIRLGQHPSQIWTNWFDLPEYPPAERQRILTTD